MLKVDTKNIVVIKIAEDTKQEEIILKHHNVQPECNPPPRTRPVCVKVNDNNKRRSTRVSQHKRGGSTVNHFCRAENNREETRKDGKTNQE